MSYRRPRAGTFAMIGGVEYPVESHHDYGVAVLYSTALENPDPTRFTRDEENGVWRAEVFTSECERLDEVVSHAKYAGHDCRVVDIADDGSVGLYCLGPNKSKAEQDGFVQIDPGTWAKTVNIYELFTYWEYHKDLLFPEWVASGYFAETPTS
jgi:hypothetical protein